MSLNVIHLTQLQPQLISTIHLQFSDAGPGALMNMR